MTDIEPCPHDHTWLLDELRKLPTPNLGRLAQPVLARVLNDQTEADPPQSQSDRESLRLLGEVLRERKTR